MLRHLLRSLLFATVCVFQTVAVTTPSAYFADYMVLQRDQPIPVWGTDEAGRNVSIVLSSNDAMVANTNVTVDSNGNFFAMLPAQEASMTAHTLRIEGTESITYRNILIGDLWLCSGQSNMARNLTQINNSLSEIMSLIRYPHIRYYQANRTTSLTPVQENSGTWYANTSTNLKNATAVGYLFARTLADTVLPDVPIGLLDVSSGGSSAEAWMERETLRRLGYTAYATSTANNNKSGATLYNAMIHPLRHVRIRGILWYQGEQNANRAKSNSEGYESSATEYASLFPNLITHWRNDIFGDPGLPFYFVQLANYENPNNYDWAAFREAQKAALSLPNVGMAVTIDIGEDGDIHPKNKQDVATRLALVALNKLYSRTMLECSGPRPVSAVTLGGGNVILTLSNATSLVLDPTKYKSGMPAFQFVEADGAFVDASPVVLSNRDGMAVIRLFSDKISTPVQVQYAWHNTPSTPLYSTVTHPLTGAAYPLPASPFRLTVTQGPNIADLSRDEMLAYAFTPDCKIFSSEVSAYLPRISISGNQRLQASFTPANPLIKYEVQESTDVQTWTTINTIYGGACEEISVEANSSIMLKPRLFLRVRVSPLQLQ